MLIARSRFGIGVQSAFPSGLNVLVAVYPRESGETNLKTMTKLT